MQPGGRIGCSCLDGLRRRAIDGFPIGGAKPGLDSAFIFRDHLI
jgi:hypothetical protein